MDQFLTPQELIPRCQQATPPVASSQFTANNTPSPLSQLVPVGEPADTSTQTLTTPASQNDAFPDYQLWCMEWWCRFPSCELDFNVKNMRVWWWAHGYRLINKQSLLPKHIWVCSICVAKSKPPPTDTYTFVSSTSKSIVKHLRRIHRKRPPVRAVSQDPDREQPERSTKRPTVAQLLGCDMDNPAHQDLVSKVQQLYNEELFWLLLMDWIVHDNLPFRIVLSERFKRVVWCLNPCAQVPSDNTLVNLLVNEYQKAVPLVRQLLGTARGMIHITFDGWTSRRNTSFLGVHAYFVDQDWRQWKLLLGLPPLVKRHTGEDLADEVSAILAYFGIEDRIGYFTLDNATNNDRCIEALSILYGFDANERRIRCAPHIINLAVRGMMYGDGSKRIEFDKLLDAYTDEDWVDDQDDGQDLREAVDRLGDDEEFDEHDDEEAAEDHEESALTQVDALIQAVSHEMPAFLTAAAVDRYRKTGPFGKLHNIGVCLRLSSQLSQKWSEAQLACYPDQQPLAWSHNVATRWLSDESMASRALSKQRAVNRLISDVADAWDSRPKKQRSDKPPDILEYRLTDDEWLVVDALQKVLNQFKISLKTLQGDGISGQGKRSTTGGFDEYFPQFELLLDHLEVAVRGFIVHEIEVDRKKKMQKVKIFSGLDRRSRQLLKVYFRLGWKKLHDYYEKLTSVAYYAAVVFHPAKKLAYLDRLWRRVPCKQRADWREWMLRNLRRLWDESYKDRVVGNENAVVEETSLDWMDRRLDYLASNDPLSDDSADDLLDSYAAHSACVRGKGRAKSGFKNKHEAEHVVSDEVVDELELYLAEPPTLVAAYKTDPIAWWRDHGTARFPRVSFMAVDMLTIASSTAETERQFNSAGMMIDAKRSTLARAVIGQAQSIRSWSELGIFRPSFPIHLLQSEQWFATLLDQGFIKRGPEGDFN